MNTPTEPDTRDTISESLREALAEAVVAAIKVISRGMEHLPAVHQKQIRAAVDAGQCALTLQVDLPSNDVRIIADGEGWLKPQVLFAVDWNQTNAQTKN